MANLKQKCPLFSSNITNGSFLKLSEAGTEIEGTTSPFGVLEYLSDYSSLSAAVAAIASTSVTLVLDMAADITANTTVPSTCHVFATKAGVMNVSTGVTLTFNGPFDAGLYQVFNCVGTGAVTFGAGAVGKCYPEWWAANTTPGTTDMTNALNAAVLVSHDSQVPVILQATTYAISDSIENLTGDKWKDYIENGIMLIGKGSGATSIKALASFPAASPMLHLNGNKDSVDVVANFVAQWRNRIKGIQFDGNSVAHIGLRLRANVYSTFKDLYIKNLVGNISDAAILIVGTTTPGNDDVDTTSFCTFDSVNIYSSTGWGVYAGSSRTGGNTFINCDIRSCTYDGMRMAFAGLSLINCTISLCGNAAATTTGGFTAAAAATADATHAINRGLVIQGCCFEANYNHEINIDYCYGYSISGSIFHPYPKVVAGTQDTIRIGVSSATYKGANGGLIASNRIQDYIATYGTITGIAIGADTNGLSISGMSYGAATDQLTIDASASNVTYNGYSITGTSLKPSFYARTINHATAIENITGDGTEYTSATLAVDSSIVEGHDNGANFATGAFTAPYAGLYTFTAYWPIAGMSGGHTNTQVYIKVGTTAYLVDNKYHGDISSATYALFGGTIQLKLAAGDVVTTSLIVSGGTKTIDIYRNMTPAPFQFSGHAL